MFSFATSALTVCSSVKSIALDENGFLVRLIADQPCLNSLHTSGYVSFNFKTES